MNKINTTKLFKFKFIPQQNPLFNIPFPMSFDCDDGWFDIIYDLCSEIDCILTDEDRLTFTVDQVKEKYGTLRFYTSWESPEITKLIRAAEDLSSETCEICGKKGKLMISGGWYKTICPEHAVLLNYDEMEPLK